MRCNDAMGVLDSCLDVRWSEKESCLEMSMVHHKLVGLEYSAMGGQGRYHIS